jgi:Rod binding domain-containing protein
MADPVSLISASSVATDLNISTLKNGTQKEQIASAAEQFEGLLIHQLLKSAASDDNKGWLGTGEEDQAGLQAMDLAQQQFASALAARGGLGLARMVISQLNAEIGTSK